jgi:hypothetical protein
MSVPTTSPVLPTHAANNPQPPESATPYVERSEARTVTEFAEQGTARRLPHAGLQLQAVELGHLATQEVAAPRIPALLTFNHRLPTAERARRRLSH